MEGPLAPNRGEQSSNLLQIIGVFYALVLGGAITNNQYFLLDPERKSYSVATLVLLATFSGAAWHYLRLSLNLARTPYDVRWVTKNANTMTEELRFGLDLLTAALYGYLLVQGLGLINHPRINLWGILTTFAVINALDFTSYLLWRAHWEMGGLEAWSKASLVLLLWPVVLLVLYVPTFGVATTHLSVNLLFAGLALVAVNGRELVERKAAWRRWIKNLRTSDKKADAANGLRVYLAGPLGFSEAGRLYHRTVLIPALIESGWVPVDPWDIAAADQQLLESQRGQKVYSDDLRDLDRRLARENIEKLDSAAVVLAVLDGPDVDSGTAAEIAYAHAKGKKTVGLRLDSRDAGDNAGVTVNLQVEHFLSNRDHIAKTLPEAIEELARPK